MSACGDADERRGVSRWRTSLNRKTGGESVCNGPLEAALRTGVIRLC